MAKLVFTAWKTKSQLLDVRNEFYPLPSYDGPDMRSHACATVEAWKLRGNVPHHVEATALLTDAILHDDVQRNSIFSIRATYSAAFCRFVTGLVDTKIHGQRKTMFQRAVDLGLPASFVELRHEATHREPPSLVVLRKASQRSLEWLWENYWATIDSDELGGARDVSRDDSVSIVMNLRNAVQKLTSESGCMDPARKKRKRDQEDAVADRLVSICAISSEASSPGVHLLPRVLLDEGVLVDSERKLGESMNAVFKKWDPILQKVTNNQPTFLMLLSEELVHDLVLDPVRDSLTDPRAEALFLWLEHLLTSSSWGSQQSFCPRGYILSICSENPTHWAKMLSGELQKQKSFCEKLSIDGSMSKDQKNGSSKANIHTSPDNIAEKLWEHGWGPVEKWDSRPLGVTSANYVGIV
ncbi:hypothetical protein N7462_004520 [Penicillium macrosclerotiorum]|uniref:uncharacterized protein n=1 Tax=Penicillium macrosclerotiorum TaxID=303699 RepID=UPI00254888F9|nr:uncharacterized protein N7462_004520 [Penicillium macrosclerotiorum]KAJ5690128.1 hypothetical protein N7462_004520 [Penicillium macrosclerotiorum]